MMTKEQSTEYIDQHIKRTDRFESQFVPIVAEELKYHFDQVANILRSNGVNAAIKSLDRLIIHPTIGPELQKLYILVGLYSANKTDQEINQSIRQPEGKAEGFGRNQEWINNLIRYFNEDYFSKVGGITKEIKDMILSVLTHGQQQGWGAEKIAAELESPGLTLARARLIVRTEVAKAYSDGKDLAQAKSQFVLEETWIATHDGLTRHSHLVVDGHTITVGSGRFHVPVYKSVKGTDVLIGMDLMRHPGDKTAHVQNFINCRCASYTRSARDQQGRLIRRTLHGAPPSIGNIIPQIPKQLLLPPIPVKVIPAPTPAPVRIPKPVKPGSPQDLFNQLKEAFGPKYKIVKQSVTDYGAHKVINASPKTIDWSGFLSPEQKLKRINHLKTLLNDYNIAPQRNKVEIIFNTETKPSSRNNTLGYVQQFLGQRTVVNFGSDTTTKRFVYNTVSRFNSRIGLGNEEFATMTHEFGHLMAGNSNFPQNNNYRKFWNEIKNLFEVYKNERRVTTPGSVSFEDWNNFYLGDYAMTNVDEFMAEGWTEYKLFGNPGKYAKAIGEIIERYFSKQNPL